SLERPVAKVGCWSSRHSTGIADVGVLLRLRERASEDHTCPPCAPYAGTRPLLRNKANRMTVALDGPRLPPAAGGAAKQLVVFVHGYGADGNDLIGWGRERGKPPPNAA